MTRFSNRFTEWLTHESDPAPRYLGAVTIAIGSLVATAALKSWGAGGWFYIADVVGVILGSLVARGYGPAFVNSTLTALGLCFFFIQPGRALSTVSSVINLILFIILSGLVSWIISLLREAVKKERVSADSKDRVISVVSHDLKDPMGAIALNAQLLEKSLEGSENVPVSKVREFVSRLQRSSEKMNTIVQDLLEAAQIGPEEFKLHPDSNDLTAIIEEVYRSFQTEAENKKIYLTRKLPSRKAIAIFEREQMKRALYALVNTAVQVTHPGGTVGIDCEIDGNLFKVSVWNTGLAVPNDGLGLYVARKIIEKHGSKVQVENTPGQGSRFSFFIASKELLNYDVSA